MFTSRGDENIAVEALRAGALDYVVKSPAIFAELPTFVHRRLREWNHIQERRRAEAEIEANAETFKKILDSASEGVLLINPAGEIVMANPAALHMFGYQAAALVGQSIELLVPEEMKSQHRHVRQMYDTHKAYGIHPRQVTALRRDGRIFTAEVRVTQIAVGRTPLYITFINDLTERMLLQEKELYAQRLELELTKEREVTELKERFTAMVTHEFRTPLSVILASTYIIQTYKDRLTPEAVSARIDGIVGQVGRMVAMLDDMLDVTKGLSGGLELELENLELVSVCRSALETIQLTDTTPHVFHFVADPPLIELRGSGPAITHIVFNLLSNACKYTPAGGHITLQLAYEAQWAVIIVEDTGMGIPEADQARLFQPFHRAKNAKHIQGTGLGLTIVKQNVDAHGGKLACESKVGVGTTFTVRLPLA